MCCDYTSFDLGTPSAIVKVLFVANALFHKTVTKLPESNKPNPSKSANGIRCAECAVSVRSIVCTRRIPPFASHIIPPSPQRDAWRRAGLGWSCYHAPRISAVWLRTRSTRVRETRQTTPRWICGSHCQSQVVQSLRKGRAVRARIADHSFSWLPHRRVSVLGGPRDLSRRVPSAVLPGMPPAYLYC